MSSRFEEIDWQSTPLGDISLRRRREPTLRIDVYEVRLGDEFLMSSLFTVAEVALATLGLAAVEADQLDVAVGGLGLGCTAAAALEDPRVRSLSVVDALGEVIGWHARGLLPLSPQLTGDPRCDLVQGDFFGLVDSGKELGPRAPARLHTVLVDIDHSPRHLLHPDNARFYTQAGLGRVRDRLHAGGVFALWSDDPPDDDFLSLLTEVFGGAQAHVVPFANPYTGGESANTVYVASAAAER